MGDLLDPAKADSAFRKRMGKYANPGWQIAVGCLLVCGVGIVAPSYGWFIMESMTEMNVAAFSGESAVDAIMQWFIIMLVCAFFLLLTKGSSNIFLSRVAENITLGVRQDLYKSIISKEIGWHDDRENSSGVMTATLASDVQLLNGVSSDGLAVQVEAMVAVLYGLIFAFVWSWPMALVGIGVLPFILIAGFIAAKADNQNMMGMEERESSDDKTDDVKAALILCADSIQNYKTVASFGDYQILLDAFENIN